MLQSLSLSVNYLHIAHEIARYWRRGRDGHVFDGLEGGGGEFGKLYDINHELVLA